MSSSKNEIDKTVGSNNASSSLNNNTNGNGTSKTISATSAKSDSPPQKKKKPMIQHLLAGGTAGFVESSICHPLDTIKTRMQLRRQTTLTKRALGSMRDAESYSATKKFGEVSVKGGALHRTSIDTAATEKSKNNVTSTKSTSNATVSVKPVSDPTVDSTTTLKKGPLHDVGWKNRTVASASKSTTATTIASSSSSAASKPAAVNATLGPFGTARRIISREGPLALYKGLTAVYTGIIPKMAIRFVSFEYYRDVLGEWYGKNVTGQPTTSAPPPQVTFVAGLLSGLTEAILVVTPAEVCKIRMQSQYHSLMDPSQMKQAKYKNVVQTAALVVKEEGLGALYKGVVPTMLRQGCNQAVNFTIYNYSKKQIINWKRKKAEEKMGVGNVMGEVTLDHWQSLLLGGLSGGMGPLVNNPLDVVKTRMQKQVIHPGKEPKVSTMMILIYPFS